jgi:hypothetical protein
MSELARRKYLERYAEPEAQLAAEIQERYGAALIVPLRREDVGFLENLAPACAAAGERMLVIAVVNAGVDADAAVHQQNIRLLRELNEQLVPRRVLPAITGSAARAVLGRTATYDVLLLDRASAGRCLAAGEGVGVARRIGVDVAFALHEQGKLRSPWLCCTDADAELPSSYFHGIAAIQPSTASGVRRVALSLPFWHSPSGDAAIDRATVEYEISLRYYALGLASVGSPYAYQSMGSCLCVLADAYAEVRGFPRRDAGEDFYLLDKLAKIGSVHRPPVEPIRIWSRVSDRVPFGTGRRVRDLIEGEQIALYHPRCFELLGVVLWALRRAVAGKNEEILLTSLASKLDAGSMGAVSTVLEDLQVFEALRDMLGASPDASVRERRLLTWFDALRTLRFIHLIEGPAGLPRLPLRDALGQAPFVTLGSGAEAQGSDLNAIRSALFSAEQALPSDIGAQTSVIGAVNHS